MIFLSERCNYPLYMREVGENGENSAHPGITPFPLRIKPETHMKQAYPMYTPQGGIPGYVHPMYTLREAYWAMYTPVYTPLGRHTGLCTPLFHCWTHLLCSFSAHFTPFVQETPIPLALCRGWERPEQSETAGITGINEESR